MLNSILLNLEWEQIWLPSNGTLDLNLRDNKQHTCVFATIESTSISGPAVLLSCTFQNSFLNSLGCHLKIWNNFCNIGSRVGSRSKSFPGISEQFFLLSFLSGNFRNKLSYYSSGTKKSTTSFPNFRSWVQNRNNFQRSLKLSKSAKSALFCIKLLIRQCKMNLNLILVERQIC